MATGAPADPAAGNGGEILGVFDRHCRIVDGVRSGTADGCRVALAVTLDRRSPRLHVIVDGQVVPGYEDVEWHSLVAGSSG